MDWMWVVSCVCVCVCVDGWRGYLVRMLDTRMPDVPSDFGGLNGEMSGCSKCSRQLGHFGRLKRLGSLKAPNDLHILNDGWGEKGA